MGETKFDLNDMTDTIAKINSRLEVIEPTTKTKKILDEQSNTTNSLVNQCAVLEKENEAKSEQIKLLNERIEVL